jgi:glycosyltransferase involved in cell wall biosynthesis
MKSAPKIAVVAHKEYPAGVRERREVEALVGAGYMVDLICLKLPGEPCYEMRGNLRIFRMPLWHKRISKLQLILEYLVFFMLAGAFLTTLQLFNRYRLVQIHNIPDFLVFTALLPKIMGAKILLDIRDPMPETFRYKYDLPENHPWIVWMCRVERVSVLFADHVLTVHEPLREIHIQRGCPRDRITAIMNLPDERIFPTNQVVAWPRKNGGRFTLVYTGTLGQRHGIHTALHALPELTGVIPDILLRIIGEGEFLPDLRRIVEEQSLSPWVSFEGFIPLDLVAQVLRTADIGICLQEGLFGEIAFPTKVAEYFAMGTPAIVAETRLTRQYFSPDMVTFIPPGDHHSFANSVLQLIGQSDSVLDKIARGKAFLKERNWATEKLKYLDIVAELTYC